MQLARLSECLSECMNTCGNRSGHPLFPSSKWSPPLSLLSVSIKCDGIVVWRKAYSELPAPVQCMLDPEPKAANDDA